MCRRQEQSRLYSPPPQVRAEFNTCAISTNMAASLAPHPAPQSQLTRVGMGVQTTGTTTQVVFVAAEPRSRNSQPKLCDEFHAVAGTCNEHGHVSILDAPPSPAIPTHASGYECAAGRNNQSCCAAAETARRLQYLCDDHDHGTIFDASSPPAIPTHASGYGCAEGSGNQRCTRRSWNCAPNTVPVR